MPDSISDRVVERLLKAEIREHDVWLKDDYRQARICVGMAARGEAMPFVAASYAVYGTHPDLVWAKMLATRKAKLGKEFSDWYDQAGNLKPDIPSKKPAIYIDEQAERAARERLAGVLAFTKTAARIARLEQNRKQGKLVQMPSPALVEARKSLRILPA